MPPRPRYDDQTDYEDPIDRYRPREDRPKAKKPITNAAAKSAYVLGMISLVPCLGAFLGPMAIVTALFGLQHVRRSPDAGGRGRAKSGLWFGMLACFINFGLPAIFYTLALLWRN